MKRILTLLSLLLLVPSVLLASSPGHAPSVSDTFLFWPNFLLFCGVLFFLLKDPFRLHWEKRRSEIEDAVNAGANEMEAAKRRLDQARETFARLDHEITELRKAIQEEAGKESEHIRAEAHERAQRVGSQAKDSIAGEQKALEVALRKELAQHVIEEAEKLLIQQANEGNDRERRRAAMDGLSGLLQ